MRRLALFAFLLAGCDLYFTDGDDEPPCAYAELSPALQYRNPDTGACESFGYPCDSRCGPCPAAADIAQPDWGMCYSECEGLDAQTCMGTAGCFATYVTSSDNDGPATYNGCWQTAPSGPVGGSCAGLDAQNCSRHDNCIAYYEEHQLARRTEAVPLSFASCQPEPAASCSGVTCPLDSHCEEQCDAQGSCKPVCVADGASCEAIDCAPGYECVEACTEPGGGGIPYCDAKCVPSTACEALATEATCKSRSDCTPVYMGDDCTCYPNGCTCNVLTYLRCETK